MAKGGNGMTADHQGREILFFDQLGNGGKKLSMRCEFVNGLTPSELVVRFLREIQRVHVKDDGDVLRQAGFC